MLNLSKRKLLLAGVFSAVGLGVLGSNSAIAQDKWPSRPIHLVVPYAAGQGTDIFARVIGAELSIALGQPVVVENKAGANGMIGTDAVAKANPDGYTLLFGNSSATVMSNALGQKTPYDLNKDLQPVAQVGAGGVVLIVKPDFPASNLKEFVEEVRKNPGKYQYATWGNGSSAHLLTEALKNQQKLKIDHVPYKAISQITRDMMGGVVDVGWTDAASSLALIQSGKIKALSISGDARAPQLPNMPTMTEEGFAIGSTGWYAFFAPAGVPKEIVQRVNKEVNAVLGAPEVKKRIVALNMAEAPLKTVDEFVMTFQKDMVTWKNLVKDNNIKVDF